MQDFVTHKHASYLNEDLFRWEINKWKINYSFIYLIPLNIHLVCLPKYTLHTTQLWLDNHLHYTIQCKTKEDGNVRVTHKYEQPSNTLTTHFLCDLTRCDSVCVLLCFYAFCFVYHILFSLFVALITLFCITRFILQCMAGEVVHARWYIVWLFHWFCLVIFRAVLIVWFH